MGMPRNHHRKYKIKLPSALQQVGASRLTSQSGQQLITHGTLLTQRGQILIAAEHGIAQQLPLLWETHQAQHMPTATGFNHIDQ